MSETWVRASSAVALARAVLSRSSSPCAANSDHSTQAVSTHKGAAITHTGAVRQDGLVVQRSLIRRDEGHSHCQSSLSVITLNASHHALGLGHHRLLAPALHLGAR
eukprot:1409659-Rhodomonas_salina.1